MKGALFLLAVILSLSVAAAEDKPAPTEVEGKQDEAAEKRTEPPGKPDRNKSKDKEIFIPSEEISEDFAVSFPVDI